MIKIINVVKNNYISWSVISGNNESIVDYIFESRTVGSEVGIKLVWLTLLRFAILDCLAAEYIYVSATLTEYEATYIEQELDRMIKYSKVNHNFVIKKPIIEYQNIVKNKSYTPIILDKQKCYIGYSGGKDSKLCYDLIKDYFEDIIKFKINFETEEYVDDYREAIEVNNKSLYDTVSAKKLYEKNGKRYYQEEDLHCCFAIPFFSVKEYSPGILAVGLQFDVVNYYIYNEQGKRIDEFDLMETYDSLKNFEKLLGHYELINFKMFVPLASVTSFAIYNILNKIYGEDELRRLNSCWYPSDDNEPCGECLKCQRVSYIYKYIGMKLNENELKALEKFYQGPNDLDYLFGSISCKQLIENQILSEHYSLKDILFVDDKISELDWGFSSIISDKFNLQIIENPLKKGKRL